MLTGGVVGHVGGPGRPPSAIREYCRGSFAQRVPILEQIADGKPMPRTIKKGDGESVTIDITPDLRDRVQAIDMLGKYGGVDKLALTVEEQPEQQITPERAADIFARLEVVKSVRNIEKILTRAADASGSGTDAG